MIGTLSVCGSSGIGLRHPHVGEMRQRRPLVGFLEVHPENYMHTGPGLDDLEDLRLSYPLSLHSVGLSLASAEGICREHLNKFNRLANKLQPRLVSAHLAWSMSEGVYLNDLLPLPYNTESLDVVASNVDHAQQVLGRRLLIENLSAYLALSGSRMTEAEFLGELVRLTGCGLLLDVNNVYVSAHNLSFVALEYFNQLPQGAIGEIHLAGHAINQTPDGAVLIDDHGSRVPEAVWQLYAEAVSRFGQHPTLIEWDADLPALDVLIGEARMADQIAAASLEGGHHACAA